MNPINKNKNKNKEKYKARLVMGPKTDKTASVLNYIETKRVKKKNAT